MWCILAFLHPVDRDNHPTRVSSYVNYENDLDMSMFNRYPKVPNDHHALVLFEKINGIPINIFYMEKEHERITPVYRTSINKFRNNCVYGVANLLFIQSEEKEQLGYAYKSHYV